MKGIFKCVENQTDTIPEELLEKLGVSYEEANHDSEKMAQLALMVKEDKNRYYPILPFCHTVEAEIFGSEITYDSVLGNRISKYAIEKEEDISKLKEISPDQGRIKTSLDAAEILKDKGEKLIFNITGPITIATSVLDTRLFYKLLRRDKDKLEELLFIIEDSLSNIMIEAGKKGVDLISYADPAGTIDIVGPKTYKDLSGKSTYRILKKIQGKMSDTTVHLCGKTSTSLDKVGLLDIRSLKSDKETYLDKIEDLKSRGENVELVGNWCMKMDISPKVIRACSLK